MNTATKKATDPVMVTEQELLNAFLEHIPDGVYFKDRNSRFLRISKALASRFGLEDPLEAIGKTDADMFSPEHAEQAFADEQAIMRSGEPIVGVEERETWEDGREAWVSSTKVPLRNHLGEIIGTMGISRDITAQRAAQQELLRYKIHLEELVTARTSELLRAKEELERDVAARTIAEQQLAAKAEELTRSNKELERFAYVASHDLQEPLRMVASYTQLLARRYKEKLDKDGEDFIEYAVDGANRMKQLIQDLLSYSRVSRKGPELKMCNSQMICQAAVANLQTAISESGAILTVDFLPMVLADQMQLTQLFQNLIGNAIKYRSKDAPKICISAKSDNHQHMFAVADNGIGIEPQYFERIFEIFQRLHTRAQYAGTGVGLAICRTIVERHGGRIWVESEPGKGSTFLFTIPTGKKGDHELQSHRNSTG